MPHATLPATSFQAFILCGPGASLNTFTSNPKEFPKALVPIANRPMVWYPLEWCYRMGITSITLISPPESSSAIKASLSQNPHLTSLPSPRPTVLAPADLTLNTGTAELFRLPEVQAAITSDFIILPCDLVCELDGINLLEAWMVQAAGFGGATAGLEDNGRAIKMGPGGEAVGRRGGLSVWYNTAVSDEEKVKGEQTDFLATASLPASIAPPPKVSIRRHLENVCISMPTDALKDKMQENGQTLPLRHSLFKAFGNVKLRTKMRDAHIYFFPYWVKEMMRKNEVFDSIGEDVVGWWAKASWQKGLGDKLGLRPILQPDTDRNSDDQEDNPLDEEINVRSYSTTAVSIPISTDPHHPSFASRVKTNSDTSKLPTIKTPESDPLTIPSIIAYIHPSTPPPTTTDTTTDTPPTPLIRRIDTAPLLLHTSLRIAKLPSISDGGSSPLTHQNKIVHPESIPQQTSVKPDDNLLDANVTIQPKVNIKESVIGANCTISSGARIVKCVLMEGVFVGENVQLVSCVIGPRARLEGGQLPKGGGDRTELKECEVQGGYSVAWETKAEKEKFMVFEGLGEDGGLEGFGGDDEGDVDESFDE